MQCKSFPCSHAEVYLLCALTSLIDRTGNARQGQVDAAKAAGMSDVYIKPYNIADIVQRIDALI